jgi:hypothetical protein
MSRVFIVNISAASLSPALKYDKLNTTKFSLLMQSEIYLYGVWGPIFALSPRSFKDTPLVGT